MSIRFRIRFILLLIFLLLCIGFSTANAENDVYTPDDTFVFRFTFTSESGVWARIGIRYDTAAFTFISA